MTMEIFSAPFAPFAVAFMIFGLLAAIEIGGLLFGVTVSDLVDGALPDFDAADGEGLAGALGWLHVGKVPLMIVIATLLAAFAAIGLTLQAAVASIFGAPLPAFAAGPLAFAASLPATRVLCGGLSRILPREETDAVSAESFVGRIAEIIRGEARAGAPAEAKLADARGQTHYILVEPDAAGAVFHQGAEVLIIERRGAIYRAARNETPSLSRSSQGGD
jgi:hypothetical protein